MLGIFYDKNGQYITQKEFAAQAKENVKKNYLPRRTIISSKLITDAQLDQAVADKLVGVTFDKNRYYYSRDDINKLISKQIQHD